MKDRNQLCSCGSGIKRKRCKCQNPEPVVETVVPHKPPSHAELLKIAAISSMLSR